MKGTAVVTGASGGIGKAIVERLSADGYPVVVHYSGASQKADQTVQQITASGRKAVAIAADVSRQDDVKKLFADAAAALGPIEVVVHAAGIMPLSPIAQGDVDTFDKVIAVNLRGSFLVMSEAANHLIEGGRLLVFSSSVLGKNSPTYGPYIASKAGVEGLAKVLANEVGPRKISVNAIAPGPVATPLFLKGKSDELIAAIAKQAPLNRIAEPDDLIPTVAFLVSPEASWINGQVIRVNGGFV
jgi:3-oxoacyl-[acyl-carrier protein] reductase